MAIQQVSVFVQNKPGALSAICKLLAESGVDMRAMFISDTKEFSILRLIADDTEKAAEVLRDQNCIVLSLGSLYRMHRAESLECCGYCLKQA